MGGRASLGIDDLRECCSQPAPLGGGGFVRAQAMLAGVRVVATDWFSNMHSMDAASAALVSFEFVLLRDERGVYAPLAGAVCAERDIEDAAHRLRRLGDGAVALAALDEALQEYAKGKLGGAAIQTALHANGIDGL